jgi:hypothetical protein
MGKQKGRFGKGKYVLLKRKFYVKARHSKRGAHFDLTIRLNEDEVRNTLLPQIERFLEELNKQTRAKQAKPQM